jgi:hypothetical protein
VETVSKLLDSLDQQMLARALVSLKKMRAEYPAYRDDELLLYLLAQALTDVKERTPLP